MELGNYVARIGWRVIDSSEQLCWGFLY